MKKKSKLRSFGPLETYTRMMNIKWDPNLTLIQNYQKLGLKADVNGIDKVQRIQKTRLVDPKLLTIEQEHVVGKS